MVNKLNFNETQAEFGAISTSSQWSLLSLLWGAFDICGIEISLDMKSMEVRNK